MRYRKPTPGCFCYQTSLSQSISYTFQMNSPREVFLENNYSWKYLFIFPATLLKVKLRHRCFSNTVKTYFWKQWSNTCYFEEQISITATEWLTSLLGVPSIRSESLSQFLKKVKVADIGPQYEFFYKYLIINCFKYFQLKT